MMNSFLMKSWLLKFFIFVIFLCPLTGYTQDTTSSTTPGLPFHYDTTSYPGTLKPLERIQPFDTARNRKRMRMVTASHILAYPTSMAALYFGWYKKYPQTRFHFFNDNHQWKQVDKVGHAYSAYIESYASMELWRWAGASRSQRVWIGGLSGAVYQTIFETLDGFSDGWGWSWGDFAANAAGSGILVGQELAWKEQRIHFKFSAHGKNYADPELNKHTVKIYGQSWQERIVKDYNGQTYWLSVNLKSFMKESSLPSWLSVAFGYGADGMFGAAYNAYTDELGNMTFNRSDIARYRQYYIAPDIDLTKIRTKNRLLKLALGALNVVKFPLPSIEYNSKQQFKFHLLHF